MLKVIMMVSAIVFITAYFLNNTGILNMHEKSPQIDNELPVDVQAMMKEIKESEYYKNLQPLKSFIEERTVVTSKTGTSGFILYLDNENWVATFRDNETVGHAMGTKEDSNRALVFIRSNKYRNATEPVLEDIPYANNICNLPKEVSKSHGKKLNGISFGKDSFNFAFESGHELDFKLLNNKFGKPAIRVFWEQW